MFRLTPKKLFHTAFVLAVSLGLLFGASRALEGTAVSACTWDPPTFLGSCATQNCEQACSIWWDIGKVLAVCDGNNFCVCFAI